MSSKLRINYILPSSRANGPGIRFTLWVQGCSIHCPGCTNVATWDPAGGQEVLIDDLIKQIKDLPPPLHGITITGGEPLDQFDSVYELCMKLFGFTSIFLTTGYTLKQILEKKYTKIADVLDILCVGPFDRDLICKNQWKGSSNQEVIFLSDDGWAQATMPVISQEIVIDSSGNSIITGFTK